MTRPSADQSEPKRTPGLTVRLAQIAADLNYQPLPADVLELSRQCLLDWVGVTIAGAREPLVEILFEDIAEQGGHHQASLIGRSARVSIRQAALLNGAASHALDYDDVNWAMQGHPSVAIIPGLLALAEYRGASGADFIAAFVAGYETACRIGRLVSPSHYRRGFHATSTVGAIGAAAGCANLLGLDADKTANAIGIAATRGAGLKAMFGTMCKPLHAGSAAENGLSAAQLAARGFDTRKDALECEQGFAHTQSDGPNVEAALAIPDTGYYLRQNLFKFHAACYMTHAAIECCARLRNEFAIQPADIRDVVLRVDSGLDGICNVQEPATGLESKFSLRLTAAFALAGIDTACTASYCDRNCTDPALIALRDKVRVEFQSGWPSTRATVTLELRNGERFSAEHDSGIPSSDLESQRDQLVAKFHSLVDPVLGSSAVGQLVSTIGELDRLANLAPLIGLCRSTSA